jgi:hypothetical protein
MGASWSSAANLWLFPVCSCIIKGSVGNTIDVCTSLIVEIRLHVGILQSSWLRSDVYVSLPYMSVSYAITYDPWRLSYLYI